MDGVWVLTEAHWHASSLYNKAGPSQSGNMVEIPIRKYLTQLTNGKSLTWLSF
jgi:hypothetical protein